MNRSVLKLSALGSCLILGFIGQPSAAFDLFESRPDMARETPDCHQWKGADWDNYIQSLFQVRDSEKYLGAFILNESLKKTMRICGANIDNAHLATCLDRISGYYRQFGESKSVMSPRMSDDDYLALQPPDSADLPDELKNQNHALPKNWRKTIEDKGWKFALFHSGTNQESRLVIYVPGGKYDRMILYYKFGEPSNDPTTYDGVQVQAIEHAEKDSKAIPKYYFRSWRFEGENSMPHLASNGGGRCVSCHLSGPRAIDLPKQPAFPTELGGVSNIEQLNKLMVRDGPIDYSPYYDPKYFPSHLQVGSSASCTDCHDGKTRQTLAYSVNQQGQFDLENIHRKVVQDKSMPYDDFDHLTDAQREKLVGSISDDYTQKLNKWLTETKCSAVDKSALPSNGNNQPTGPKLPRKVSQ